MSNISAISLSMYKYLRAKASMLIFTEKITNLTKLGIGGTEVE